MLTTSTRYAIRASVRYLEHAPAEGWNLSFQIVSDSFRYFQIVSDSFRYFQVLSDSFR